MRSWWPPMGVALIILYSLALGVQSFLVTVQRPRGHQYSTSIRAGEPNVVKARPIFWNAPTVMKAAEGEEKEGEASAEEGAAPAAADDIMNTIPFLTKRKEALEKEAEKLEVNLQSLDEQFKNFEEEWSKNIAVMQNDYDILKNRYYNDTLEAAMDGKAMVFQEILDTIDDFERAKMAYKPETDRQRAIVERYESVKDKMVGGLLSQGMEEVDTVGQAFDFMFHDCLFTEDSMEYEDGVITREFAKGFKMGGKCMRPAKVATSRGPGPN